MLVSRPEQVEHGLDRVERFYRNFHEERVPVRHRSVPEPRQFQSLEFPSLKTLHAYKSGLLVHVFEEIEFFTLVFPQAAYQVNRVEMGGL